MKRNTMKFVETARRLAVITCCAAFIALALAAPDARAQEIEERQQRKTDKWLDILERQKKAIVGSWFVNVDTPGFPSLKVLLTFTEDGNVLGTAQADVAPARALSVAHGAWAHQGGLAFATTFFQISYEIQTGNLRGLVKFRITPTLDSSGNAWSGPYKFDFLSPTGALLFSAGGTTQGQRIQVDLQP